MYKSPYLQMLEEDRNEADKNEARTLSSIQLIQNTPLTLDKLIKENEDRRNKLEQEKFTNNVTTQTQTRLDSQEARNKAEDKRVADVDVRDYETTRGADLLTNAVRGVLGSMGNTSGQPAPTATPPVAPPVSAPKPVPNIFTGSNSATQSLFSPTTAPVEKPVIDESAARVNERTSGPLATAPVAPQQAAPVSGVVSLLTKDPIIKEAFEKLKADLAKYPEFANRYRDEDILGEVARQLQEQDRYSDKTNLARDKQDTADKLAQARIDRLNRPSTTKPKAEKDWPVNLTQAERFQLKEYRQTLDRMDVAADRLINNKFEPGVKEGVEHWIRNRLKLRNPEDAVGYAALTRELNTVIHKLAGATVTDQELTRIMQSMPSTFDDKDTLAAFIDTIRAETANNYNRTFEYADIGKRSPTPMADRPGAGKLDSKGKPIVPTASNAVSALDKILDEAGF